MRISYPIYELLKREKVQYFKIQNGILSSKKITKKPKTRENHFFLKNDLDLPDGVYYIQDFYKALKLFFELQKNPYEKDFIADFIPREDTPHDDRVVKKYDWKLEKHVIVHKDPEVKYIHSSLTDQSNLYLHFKEITDFDYHFDDTTEAFKFDDCSEINLLMLKEWTKHFMKSRQAPINKDAIQAIKEEVAVEIQDLFDNDKTLTLRGKTLREIQEKLRVIRFETFEKTGSYDSSEPCKEEVELEMEIKRLKKHDRKIRKINKIANEKLKKFNGELSVNLVGDGDSIRFQTYDSGHQRISSEAPMGSTEKEFEIPFSNTLLPCDVELLFDVDVEKKIVHYFNDVIHYIKYY